MIRDIDGVPHWFTWLWHKWSVRRCQRTGHVGTPVAGGVCTHCGYIWFTRDD